MPVLLHFYLKNQISASRLVEVFSKKPAEFLGIEREFGSISEGQRFRAVLVDLDSELQEHTEKQIHSLSKNSCFLGEKLPGQIKLHATRAGLFHLEDRPLSNLRTA